MKRWSVAFLVAVLACVPLLIFRASSPSLLQDSDTAVLLAATRQRHDPWSWFVGDWPLGNHFYRPISTLTFELDDRLYGNQAWGYGLTNALLCVFSVLALFWFLRELTDRPSWAAVGAVLFAMWHGVFTLPLAEGCLGLAVATVFVGILRHAPRIGAYLPAALILTYLASETTGIEPLYSRMIQWLPGRTASTMTVFALIAMAAFARAIRLGRRVEVREPITPLTPPATRNTKRQEAIQARPFGWHLLALVALALALASYEQAVMLPACLLAVAITMRWQGYRPAWGWQAPIWAVLIGYLALRHAIIPSGTSSYQAQQLRYGPGVWLDLTEYLFPPLATLPAISGLLDLGPGALFMGQTYTLLLEWASAVTAAFEARRAWIFAVAGWGMSILAFLPMAWVKKFEHYHYWPMALRTLLVLALGNVAWRLVTTAWCLPSRQAPLRSAPAPGSLPRP